MESENHIEKSHDSWSVFKIMGELVEGYEKLSQLGPCVSIFGSARTKPDNKFYKEDFPALTSPVIETLKPSLIFSPIF